MSPTLGISSALDAFPNNQSPTIIRLSSTKAAAVDDAEESWKPFEFILDGFTYDIFYDRAPTKSKLRPGVAGQASEKNSPEKWQDGETSFFASAI